MEVLRWIWSSAKGILKGFSVVLVLIVVFNSFELVPARHVGIVFNRISGKINSEPSTGLVLHLPFLAKVYKVSTYNHTLNLGVGTDSEGEPFDSTITAQTRDGQWLRTQLDVQYRVEPKNAKKVYEQYQSNDRSVDANIIMKMPPVIQRSVESVTTKYDVVEALGEKRDLMRQEIEDKVREEMAKYGITLESLSLIDTDAGDEIEKAIANEAVEQQAIQTAKQRQEKARIENQTKLEQVTAEADRKKIQSQAEADANKRIADSVTPELISYKEAEARMKHGWITVQTGQAIVDTENVQKEQPKKQEQPKEESKNK